MQKISVILPCYNVERYIRECLQTIVQQTIGIDALQIIAVDNGSTDGTGEVLREYESRYPENILLVNIEQNQKPGYARNIGLAYATCPYTIFVDSDDGLMPEAFAELYIRMKESDVDILEFDYAYGKELTNMRTDSKNTGEFKVFAIETENDRYTLFADVRKNGMTWNKLFKTSFLKENKLFFAEGLKHEDTIFAIMILLYANKYATYERCLYGYRINDTGITWSCKKNDYGQFDRCKVQLMMIEECDRRGLLEKYYELIEAYFVIVYYGDTMNIVLRRFEYLPQEEVKEMQQTVKAYFPGYRNNCFFSLPKYHYMQFLLETVEMDFTEELFQSLKQRWNSK
jgi:glycosyltransferase involved in cell wall biosynthesis